MRSSFLSICILLCGLHLNAQDFRFGHVSKEEVMEEAHKKDKEANAAVLYRKVNTYYEISSNAGFTVVTEVHERIKIYNKDGFDWANQEITYYQNGSDKESVSGLKAYTYNIIDGKLEKEKLRKKDIFEEEINKYRLKTKFAMPAVSEGSVIEFEYSLRSPFVTSIDDIALQYTVPINRLEVRVKVPEFLGYKKHFNPKATVFFQIEEESEPFKYVTSYNKRSGTTVVTHSTETATVEYLQNLYTINSEDIPALKMEPHVDYLQNYAAVLKWELQYTRFPQSSIENFSQTWEGVAKNIYDDAFSRELGRDGFFKDEIDELIKDTPDNLSKARLIYSFVKKKVKWNGFLGFIAENGSKSAYKEGVGNIGDINLLLTAMFKYAGLKADPVLLSTQDNGIPVFPTRRGFNYVVSMVQLPGGSFLLDASDSNAAFGELPKRARNWQGRILRPDGTSDWVNLMPTSQAEELLNLNVSLNPDGTLKGKNLRLFSGLSAKEYRDEYLEINPQDYVQMLEKNKGDIIIENLEKENEKEIGEKLKEVYEFELPDGIEKIGNKILLKPFLFAAIEENPFKADERSYPIFFDYPSRQVKVVNIRLPEGFKVEAMPESTITKFNNGACTYQFTTMQSGNFLRFESIFDLKTTVYGQQDYAMLKEFFDHIVEKETEVIILSKI